MAGGSEGHRERCTALARANDESLEMFRCHRCEITEFREIDTPQTRMPGQHCRRFQLSRDADKTLEWVTDP